MSNLIEVNRNFTKFPLGTVIIQVQLILLGGVGLGYRGENSRPVLPDMVMVPLLLQGPTDAVN